MQIGVSTFLNAPQTYHTHTYHAHLHHTHTTSYYSHELEWGANNKTVYFWDQVLSVLLFNLISELLLLLLLLCIHMWGYMMYMCTAHMCSWCTQRPEEDVGILSYHSLTSSLKMGSLAEPGARLAARKPSWSSVLVPCSTGCTGTQLCRPGLSCGCWECELRYTHLDRSSLLSHLCRPCSDSF